MNKNLLYKSVLIIGTLIVFLYGIFGIPKSFSGQGLLSAMTERIHLGLDLRGGTHLILQVQVNDAVKVDSDNAVEVLKEQLNKRKIAFSEVSKPDPDNNIELKCRSRLISNWGGRARGRGVSCVVALPNQGQYTPLSFTIS